MKKRELKVLINNLTDEEVAFIIAGLKNKLNKVKIQNRELLGDDWYNWVIQQAIESRIENRIEMFKELRKQIRVVE